MQSTLSSACRLRTAMENFSPRQMPVLRAEIRGLELKRCSTDVGRVVGGGGRPRTVGTSATHLKRGRRRLWSDLRSGGSSVSVITRSRVYREKSARTRLFNCLCYTVAALRENLIDVRKVGQICSGPTSGPAHSTLTNRSRGCMKALVKCS